CPIHEESGSGTNQDGQLTLEASEATGVTPCAEEPAGAAATPSPTPTPAPTSVQVRYALRFDPATQHLTGTKNGQPFWAVPVVFRHLQGLALEVVTVLVAPRHRQEHRAGRQRARRGRAALVAAQDRSEVDREEARRLPLLLHHPVGPGGELELVDPADAVVAL